MKSGGGHFTPESGGQLKSDLGGQFDRILQFNSGYIIRRNHPTIIKELEEGVNGNSPYLEGLKAGAKQYENELEPKMKAFQKDRSEQKSRKDRGLEI